MHLPGLTDADIPIPRPQASDNAVRVLKVAYIGDLTRGEASPEPLQILLLH